MDGEPFYPVQGRVYRLFLTYEQTSYCFEGKGSKQGIFVDDWVAWDYDIEISHSIPLKGFPPCVAELSLSQLLRSGVQAFIKEIH